MHTDSMGKFIPLWGWKRPRDLGDFPLHGDAAGSAARVLGICASPARGSRYGLQGGVNQTCY